MSFANPAFLFALGLLTIPVIIHLFNFRKFKRVFFTNVALLEEVKEQTQSTSRLKNLLILLARLLALAALIIAFSEPFINTKSQTREAFSTVGIFIDNSPSMGSKGEEGILLQEAILKGRSIIEAFPENTSYILATNNSGPKLQRELTREEALDEIELIKEGMAAKSMTDGLKKLQSIANGKPIGTYLVSDFQVSNANISELTNNKAASIALVPVSGNSSSNLAIDSVWFGSPTHLLNGKEELSIQLINYGTENSDNVTVELLLNDRPAGLSTVSIPAGGAGTASITFVNKLAGSNRCEVRVNDSPIVFDNNYYFTYRVNDKLKVVEIQGKQANQAIKDLFSGDPDYVFSTFTEQNINYNQLKAPGSLVMNELESISTGLINTVISKLQNGESVAIFPAKNANLSSYNLLLSKVYGTQLGSLDTATIRVSRLENKHPFYRNIFDKIPANIDLPVSKSGYTTQKSSNSKAQALLKLPSGNDFLSISTYKGGQLFLFNTPLNIDNGNFSQHGLFAPIMLRIAESSGYLQQMSYTIGDVKPIEILADSLPKENLFKMRARNATAREIIPLARKTSDNILLYPPADELNPGNYDIIADDSQVPLSGIGVNLPRTESDTRLHTIAELEELCNKSNGRLTLLDEKPEKITNEIKGLYQNQKLWLWFILLTLIFLTIEILLTKWLK